MSTIFCSQHTVGPEDLDSLGHVNNVVFVRWMQDAAVAHSASLGWTMAAYRKLGAAFVVRRHEIVYHGQLRQGDEVAIRTWVADLKRITSRRQYEIFRSADQQMVARAETDWAFLDLNTGRPRRIPPEVADAFPIHGAEFTNL